MNTLTKKTLKINLQQATKPLLELVRTMCWNKISDNTYYILSEINNPESLFFESLVERNSVKNNKEIKSLEQVANELKTIYENLYDINLYIFKSEKKKQ